MSQAADPPSDDAPLDPQVERLVAYLDGELPPDEGERFESELVDDPTARTRLEDLGRVWNALDALPRATAPASFTQSTVEMAATSGGLARGDGESTARPRGWIGVGVMIAGVAASLGWLLTVGLSGALDRRDLLDLPAALHATALEEAVSIDFLRRLADRGATLVNAYDDEPRVFDAADWATVQQAAVAPRRVWIDQRSPAQIAELSDRMARFRALSPARQDSLREQAIELAAQPDADELRRVALAYQSAVSRLPASERARLRELSDTDRLRELSRGIASDLVEAAAFRLTDAESAEIRAAIERRSSSRGLARDRIERVLEMRGLPEAPIERFWMMTGVIVRMPRQVPRAIEQKAEWLIDLWRGYAERFAEAAPERIRKTLELAGSDRELARGWLLLLREATGRGPESVFVSQLSNAEIARTLLLPRDGFNEALADRTVEPADLSGPPGFLFGPPPPDGREGPDRRGRRGRGADRRGQDGRGPRPGPPRDGGPGGFRPPGPGP